MAIGANMKTDGNSISRGTLIGCEEENENSGKGRKKKVTENYYFLYSTCTLVQWRGVGAVKQGST